MRSRNSVGSSLLNEGAHPRGLQLEYPAGGAGADELIRGGIIQRDPPRGLYFQALSFSARASWTSERMVRFRSPRKSILRRPRASRSYISNWVTNWSSGRRMRGTKFLQGLGSDHHAGRVCGGVAGKSPSSLRAMEKSFGSSSLKPLKVRAKARGPGPEGHTEGDELRDTVSLSRRGYPEPCATSRMTEREAMRSKVPIWAMWSRPYFSATYSRISSLRRMQKSMSMSGRLTLSGFRKALKKEAKFEGVDLGNAQAISHEGARGGPPSRPHGDPIRFAGVIHKVGHDEEIRGEVHPPDYGKLVREALASLRLRDFLAVASALAPCQVRRSSSSCGRVSFHGEPRQQVSVQKKGVSSQAFRNLQGVLEGLRNFPEFFLHLFWAQEVIVVGPQNCGRRDP
jgi:hypothetical protein